MWFASYNVVVVPCKVINVVQGKVAFWDWDYTTGTKLWEVQILTLSYVTVAATLDS